MRRASYGFIGLGRMGAPMATRLLEAGYDLIVHDSDPGAVAQLRELGAQAADSPSAVAQRTDVVLLSLPTPDVVRAVTVGEDGISAGGSARIVLDLSTTGPEVAVTIGETLAARAIRFVDAPVSGGVAGAVKGSLTLMVSCPRQTFRELEGLLGCFGRAFLVGEEPGMGQTMKVINNLVSVTALAVSSEALALGTKRGLDPQRMLEVINAGTGRNGATMDKIPKHVLSGNFDFGFSVALSRKDTGLCLDDAEQQGVPMIVGSAVRQLLTITQARYGVDADMMTLARCIEEWAGVEIRGDGSESG